MKCRQHWTSGTQILIRHIWFGKIWAAFPVTVIEDSIKRITVYLASGTPFMAPACTRAEYLNVLASRKWQLIQNTWHGQNMLWRSVPGEACSIWTI